MSDFNIDYDKLKIIDFGADDANDDNNITSYFYDFDNFVNKLSSHYYLVKGRKGIGKTALRKQFASIKNDSANSFAEEISLADLPHKKQIFQNSADVSYLWRFFIIVEIMKCLIKDESIDLEHKKNIKAFLKKENYIVSSGADLVRKIYNKGEVSIGLIGVGNLGLGGEANDHKLKYKNILPELENFILDILSTSNEYYLVFDQLDDYYDTSIIQRDYLTAIIHFLKQIKNLNTAAVKKDKKIKAIVFIRDDIFESLNTLGSDINKLDDYTLSIQWGEQSKSSSGNNMREMIKKRIQNSYNRHHLEAEFPFDDSLFTYIFDRTFFRPRDVIKFFKFLVSAQDLKKAENLYSDWFKREIANEVCVDLPIISSIYDIISRIGYTTFSYNDFKRRYSDIKNEGDKDLSSFRPAYILKILYKYSVIGNYHYSGGEYYFYYKYRDINASISLDSEFSIHRGLHKVFKLHPSKILHNE